MYQQLEHPAIVLVIRDGFDAILERYSELEHYEKPIEELVKDVLWHVSVNRDAEVSIASAQQAIMNRLGFTPFEAHNKAVLCDVFQMLAAAIWQELKLHHMYDETGTFYYRFAGWVSHGAMLLRPYFNKPMRIAS